MTLVRMVVERVVATARLYWFRWRLHRELVRLHRIIREIEARQARR